MRCFLALLASQLLRLTAAYYTAFDSASWAITSTNTSDILSPHKQSLYDNHIYHCNLAFVEGNVTKAKVSKHCEDNDALRIEMNAEQPSSVRNYTTLGYKKISTPPALFRLLQDFWKTNRHRSEQEWTSPTVYQNSWDAPSEMVHLARNDFGGSNQLQQKIFDATKPVLEEWTQHYLDPVSLWGIRVYTNGSILVPHVDRMPLIISAIS